MGSCIWIKQRSFNQEDMAMQPKAIMRFKNKGQGRNGRCEECFHMRNRSTGESANAKVLEEKMGK